MHRTHKSQIAACVRVASLACKFHTAAFEFIFFESMSLNLDPRFECRTRSRTFEFESANAMFRSLREG